MRQFQRVQVRIDCRAEHWSPRLTTRGGCRKTGGIASVREGQVGVAVRCVDESRGPDQFGCIMRGWGGSALGPRVLLRG